MPKWCELSSVNELYKIVFLGFNAKMVRVKFAEVKHKEPKWQCVSMPKWCELSWQKGMGTEDGHSFNAKMVRVKSLFSCSNAIGLKVSMPKWCELSYYILNYLSYSNFRFNAKMVRVKYYALPLRCDALNLFQCQNGAS